MAMRRAPVVSTEQRSWTRGTTPSEAYFQTATRNATTTATKAVRRSLSRSWRRPSTVAGSA